ncbi:MAG TPA: sugar porter family MFS transporter [Acidobacteriaceae bacterium]|nr:sugar porter family MFS transporter [Acidobacteriaceae bacterium]
MMQGSATPRTAEAIIAPRHPGYVWGIAIAAAMGGLLFGYDWVVIGGARQFYEIYFHLTSAVLVGWANSSALVGCLLGSLIAGSLADRYGRRRVLLASAILFALSSVLTGESQTFLQFIVWRIAGGLAIGLSSNVSPVYIAETSPSAVRGRLVSLNQFAIVVGILLAQVVNWLIARPVPSGLSEFAIQHSWNVQHGWRWMFIAVAAPAVVFTGASLLLPESPRWLLVGRREEEARDVLDRIGGPQFAVQELTAIERALAADVANRSSWRDLLRSPARHILLIGIALAVLQQWTGINVLFNYAGDVYRSAGYGANQIFLDIVITGTINLVFTILAMLLVDRIGRRKMMIFGSLGIGFSHLLCAWAYHEHWPAAAVLTLTLSAIACYAVTLAPVTWVLISEIFPNRMRAHGVSISVSALWAASFLLTYSFPALSAHLGSAGVFSAYGAICFLGTIMVTALVPETKGRTLEQIEAEFGYTDGCIQPMS